MQGLTTHEVEGKQEFQYSAARHAKGHTIPKQGNLVASSTTQSFILSPSNSTFRTLSQRCVFVCVSFSVKSESLRPHGLQPARLLHLWDFPGKSTGVGCLKLHLKCNCLAEKSGNNVSKAFRGHKVLVASPVKQSEMCTTLCE